MRTPKRNLCGYSLLEALIAGFLLAVGILSLVFSLHTSSKLIITAQNSYFAAEVAKQALSILEREKDYGKIYQKYKVYDDGGPDRRFYILEDQTILWDRPKKPPEGARGEGFFTFVTHEWQYSEKEWGTETAFFTDGKIHPGKIDLDGNGKAEDRFILIGRTAETPVDEFGYFIILPVKVTVRFYDSSTDNYIIVERKTWLSNNFR